MAVAGSLHGDVAQPAIQNNRQPQTVNLSPLFSSHTTTKGRKASVGSRPPLHCIAIFFALTVEKTGSLALDHFLPPGPRQSLALLCVNSRSFHHLLPTLISSLAEPTPLDRPQAAP